MATPSLFPVFLKSSGGGGGPVTLNQAIISELEIEVATYEVELAAPIEVEVAEPIEFEVPEPTEVETCS